MRYIDSIKLCAAAVAIAVTCAQTAAAPVKVELARVGERWELRRDGKAFFVKGAGDTNHLDQLAAAGANSVRT